jgi:hypothetical protein
VLYQAVLSTPCKISLERLLNTSSKLAHPNSGMITYPFLNPHFFYWCLHPLFVSLYCLNPHANSGYEDRLKLAVLLSSKQVCVRRYVFCIHFSLQCRAHWKLPFGRLRHPRLCYCFASLYTHPLDNIGCLPCSQCCTQGAN